MPIESYRYTHFSFSFYDLLCNHMTVYSHVFLGHNMSNVRVSTNENYQSPQISV